MSSFGQIIPITLFGESHGEAIGIVIDNLPPGLALNKEKIHQALYKRRPKSRLSTPRQEQDEYRIVSGYFNNQTTGAPLTILIPNMDTRSKDYNPDVLRPSHSDYTAKVRYSNANDYRGSGHFSGRLTAPLVILGAICESFLEKRNIFIGSHISSIKDICDVPFDPTDISNKTLERLNSSDFPTLNEDIAELYKAQILDAKDHKDSVGGTIETAVIGIPAGFGGPYFETVESLLGSLLFSIPAVKGVEFGKGFDITSLYGSESNDPFTLVNGLIKTKTNNSGGLQGGITNGMPLTFKVAIKPTSSIGKPQQTVNIASMEEVILELEGRHDPAIVHRVIHVVNAVTNYAIVELLCRKEGTSWIK
jgi:chorismate synthase